MKLAAVWTLKPGDRVMDRVTRQKATVLRITGIGEEGRYYRAVVLRWDVDGREVPRTLLGFKNTVKIAADK